MKLANKSVLITGASGGIGRAIAVDLAKQGCRLALLGRNSERLRETERVARLAGAEVVRTIVGNLGDSTAIDEIVMTATSALGGVDVVLFAHGVNHFDTFDGHDDDCIDELMHVNVVAPLQLARRLLPAMKERRDGAIVAIGSIFGTIGYPSFSVYSATKFALRGFCEGLRRELAGSGVEVIYVAPRGTKTAMTDDYAEMAKQTGMNLDSPEWVAGQVVIAMARSQPERFLGFRERLFARINRMFPRLLDGPLVKENQKMAPFLPKAPPLSIPPRRNQATAHASGRPS